MITKSRQCYKSVPDTHRVQPWGAESARCLWWNWNGRPSSVGALSATLVCSMGGGFCCPMMPPACPHLSLPCSHHHCHRSFPAGPFPPFLLPMASFCFSRLLCRSPAPTNTSVSFPLLSFLTAVNWPTTPPRSSLFDKSFHLH